MASFLAGRQVLWHWSWLIVSCIVKVEDINGIGMDTCNSHPELESIKAQGEHMASRQNLEVNYVNAVCDWQDFRKLKVRSTNGFKYHLKESFTLKMYIIPNVEISICYKITFHEKWTYILYIYKYLRFLIVISQVHTSHRWSFLGEMTLNIDAWKDY